MTKESQAKSQQPQPQSEDFDDMVDLSPYLDRMEQLEASYPEGTDANTLLRDEIIPMISDLLTAVDQLQGIVEQDESDSPGAGGLSMEQRGMLRDLATFLYSLVNDETRAEEQRGQAYSWAIQVEAISRNVTPQQVHQEMMSSAKQG